MKEFSATDFPFGLGSDNHTAVHPQILDAIVKVNLGWTPSYGTDPVSNEAIATFRDHFGSKTQVLFCFNGTAANVLSLAPLLRPYHSVLVSDSSHLHVDECGAPERHLGSKLIAIQTADGKLSPELMAPFLIRRGDQHFSQVRAVSITQPTELGTLYTRRELDQIVDFCHTENLLLHIDGARFANAAERLELSFADLSRGADVLSFGGTKNGLLGGEAVLFLSDSARELAKDAGYIRKQLMQLPSKTRFISAQFCEYLGTSLWKEIASNSCERALQLERGLRESSAYQEGRISITQKVESNAVFARIEREAFKALRDAAFFYVWNESTNECRLMTSWSTEEHHIESFLNRARGLSKLHSNSQARR